MKSEVLSLAKEITQKIFENKIATSKQNRAEIESEIQEMESQISGIVKKIVANSNDTLIKRLELEIEAIAREQESLRCEPERIERSQISQELPIDRVLEFLGVVVQT